jgi:hypothetical protein
MSSSNEVATLQYNKLQFACFLVPNQPRKWLYGMLLHDIGWDVASDCGTFLMEDVSVRTVHIGAVDKAVARVTIGEKHTSEYIMGLGGGKYRVYMARSELRERQVAGGGQNPEADEFLYKLMNDSIREYRASNPAKAPKAPKPTRPELPKSYLPLPSKKSKTRVAALSGSQCDLAVLHTLTGWVKSIYQKIFTRENTPYLICWASKPPQ